MNLKKFFLLLFIFLTFTITSYAQVNIGIFYFVPEGEDLPWLRKGMAILLSNQFSLFDDFNILSRDKIEELDYHTFTPKNVRLLSDKFSLDFVIGGTYTAGEDGAINVNAWTWERERNKFLVNFSVKGTLLDIIKKLSISLFDSVKGGITEDIAAILKDLPTQSEDACRYLFIGVDYMDQAIKTYKGVDFPSKPLWKNAIENAEKATKIDPKFSLAYYYLGLMYSKTKWIKKETIAWDNYLKYTKENSFPEDIGGLAYFRLGYSFYEKNNYDMAKKYLKRALEIDPTSPKPYIYLGNIYYKQDDLDKAIYYYERANSLSPDDENIKWLLKKAERVKEVGKEAYEYFEEGRKLYLNADYANAAFYLEHAVGINPSYLEALVLLGKSYMRIGELKKAEDAFSKAKLIDPTNYELELLLDEVKNKIKYGIEAYEAFDKGYKLYREGKLEEALLYFKEAVNKNPSYDVARNYLARIYYKLGKMSKYKEEKERIASLIKDPKKKADVYYLIGYEFFALKDYEAAILEFEKALSFYPKHIKASFFLGEAYYNLKRYKDAVKYYTIVIDNAKDGQFYEKALYGRGWANFFLKNYEDEIKDFLTLIEVFKDSSFKNIVYYKLGEAYYLRGDYLSAINYLEQFTFSETPYRKDAFYIIIASYIKTKNFSNAKLYLDKAKALYPDDKSFDELVSIFRDYVFENKEYELLLEELKGKNDELSLYQRIIALIELSKMDEAEFQFSKFKAKFKDSAYLKDIYLSFLSVYLKHNDKEKAIEILKDAIDENVSVFPSIYKTFAIRGKLYFELRDYGKAIYDFENAVKGSIENLSEVYYLLGLSYDKIGDKNKALDIFSKLSGKFKDSYSSLASYYLGGYYFKQKDWDNALKFYKRITLISKDIDYLDKVHLYLGIIHFYKKNYGKAIWNFKRSLLFAKDENIKMENYYYMGKAYIAQGKKDEGKKYLEIIVKEGQDTKFYSLAKEIIENLKEAPYKEVEAMIEKKKFREALSLINKIKENTERKVYLEAKIYLGLGDWQNAEEKFLYLLNNHPENDIYEDIIYGLSFVYFKEKKYFLVVELSKDYLKRNKFGSLGDDILYLSGLSYEMLGKLNSAKEVYKKILNLFPHTLLKNKIEKRLEVIK